jgi:hypothetical protein
VQQVSKTLEALNNCLTDIQGTVKVVKKELVRLRSLDTIQQLGLSKSNVYPYLYLDPKESFNDIVIRAVSVSDYVTDVPEEWKYFQFGHWVWQRSPLIATDARYKDLT